MDGCTLPTVGSDTGVLVLTALLVLGAGIALMLIVRRRGFGGAAAIALAVGLGGTALVVAGAHKASAASCASETTIAGTVAPTSIAAPTTTIPGVTTTAAPATTTAVTTTTTSTSTTTTTTTTTVPQVADLTPRILGSTSLVSGVSGTYGVEITNVGPAPSSGPMTFVLNITILSGGSVVSPSPQGSNDWTFVGASGGNLTYESKPGVVLAPGAVSTTTFGITWNATAGSSVRLATTLPTGIGGETDAANNSASLIVVVTAAP